MNEIGILETVPAREVTHVQSILPSDLVKRVAGSHDVNALLVRRRLSRARGQRERTHRKPQRREQRSAPCAACAAHCYSSVPATNGTKLTGIVRSSIVRPYVQELSGCDAQLAGLPDPIRRSVRPALTLVGGNGWGNRLKIMARILATRTALIGP